MFKNVMVYGLGSGWRATLQQVEEGLDKARFVECGASQERSVGWIEPRGEAHGPLVESVGGQFIVKLMIESKAVPASVVKRKADERAAEIEAATGRKPGKKEVRDLREEAKLTLLPMAFAKRSAVLVWIDPDAQRLVIDAGSQARADEVVTCLVKALDGFAVVQLNTNTSATAAMSEWLSSQEPPAGFSVDRECELKAVDASKSVIKYAHHALDIDEVRQHIAEGKLPTKLAMTWEGRVSFMLTESLQIRKLGFLDGVFEGTSQEKEDGFDADTAIATGELRQMIPALLLALGGEAEIGVAAPVDGAGAEAVAVKSVGVGDPAESPF